MVPQVGIRDVALLGSRLVLGGYMVAHGAQKLFGSFGGSGLDAAAEDFAQRGLSPGRNLATTAALMELVGGVLTATGAANPLGPLMVMGTMTLATTTSRTNGPFAARKGYELPLTNEAVAAALAVSGPGQLTLKPHLSKGLTQFAVVVGAGTAGALIRQVLLAEHAAEQAAEGAPAGDEQPAPDDSAAAVRRDPAEPTIASSALDGNPSTSAPPEGAAGATTSKGSDKSAATSKGSDSKGSDESAATSKGSDSKGSDESAATSKGSDESAAGHKPKPKPTGRGGHEAA